MQVEQLAWREEGVDVELLRHDADRGARLARTLAAIDAPDRRLAAALVAEAGEDVDERRLAGAVRAKQAEERAARDDEVNGIERRPRRAAIALGQAGNGDGMRGY